ncbi:MAG: hypothetical protein MJ016_02775 [Victivallaceae bacterium]|nr:hypothetical protein [Victivallaceae bacterium]
MDQKIVIAVGAVFLIGIAYHFVKVLQLHFRLRAAERRHREEITRIFAEKALSLQALNDAQTLNVRANDRLAEENGRLREQLLNQQAAILALRNDTTKQEKIELQIVREALEKMQTTAPGFSAAWQTAYDEAREKFERETASGVKAWLLKCFSPRMKSAPALPKSADADK